jgi:hypothetical protein
MATVAVVVAPMVMVVVIIIPPLVASHAMPVIFSVPYVQAFPL